MLRALTHAASLRQCVVAIARPQLHRSYNEVAAARSLLEAVGGRGSVTLDMSSRGPVAVLTLSNPKARNALSPRMMAEFAAAVDRLESWPEGRAVVLVGDGGSFCSGADLASSDQLFSPRYGRAMLEVMTDATRRLSHLPLISVAAIEGAAVGGGTELATAADFRIMTPTATFQMVQVSRGVVPGWGGMARLVEIVGRKNALFLLGSCSRLTATQCAQFNLCDAIVAPPAPPGEAAAESGEELGTAAPSLNVPPGDSHALSGVHNNYPADITAHAIDFLEPFLGDDKDLSALRALKRALGSCKTSEQVSAAEREEFTALWGSEGQLKVLNSFRKQPK